MIRLLRFIYRWLKFYRKDDYIENWESKAKSFTRNDHLQ